MAKDKYTASQVYEEIATESSIICGNCGKSKTVMADGYDAAEHFFTEGWRVTPNKCYCPSCASKNLKQVGIDPFAKIMANRIKSLKKDKL